MSSSASVVLVGAVVLGLGAPVRAAPPAPSSSIIGGTPTTPGEYPTVVFVKIGSFYCTGTLVGPTWVLTAGDCLDPAVVGLTSQDQVTASTEVHLKTIDFWNDPGEVIKASATFKDPLFSQASLGLYDLGLIQLATPVTDITPSSINSRAAAAPVGAVATQVGYGITNVADRSFGVEYELRDRASVSCASLKAGSDTNLLCFSHTDGRGTCSGDGGAPAFAMVAGRPTVIAVESFGDSGCAVYDALTRIDAERAFLMTHVPELLGCVVDPDCAAGWICFSHSCIAEPFGPRGLGTMCNAAADCDSSICAARGPDASPADKRCSLTCSLADANACPAGFDCVASGASSDAVCWPADSHRGGGGCAVAGDGGSAASLLGLGAIAFARRRRQRGPAS
jgi:MYXO-CTERM domain-containing protein